MEKGSLCYAAVSSEMELPKMNFFQAGEVVLVLVGSMENKWLVAKVITTYLDKKVANQMVKSKQYLKDL